MLKNEWIILMVWCERTFCFMLSAGGLNQVKLGSWFHLFSVSIMMFLLMASMIHNNGVIFLIILQKKARTTSITATENDFIISLNQLNRGKLNQNDQKDSDKSEHLGWKHFCWFWVWIWIGCFEWLLLEVVVWYCSNRYPPSLYTKNPNLFTSK